MSDVLEPYEELDDENTRERILKEEFGLTLTKLKYKKTAGIPTEIVKSAGNHNENVRESFLIKNYYKSSED